MSHFEAIAEQVRNLRQDEEQQAQRAYVALLEALHDADGTPPAPDEVLAVLREAGKTSASFEADFARYRQLRTLQTQIQREPEIQEALTAAVAAWNEATEEKRRVLAEIDERIGRHAAEEQRLGAELDHLGKLRARCAALQGLKALGALDPARAEGLKGEPEALPELVWAFFGGER